MTRINMLVVNWLDKALMRLLNNNGYNITFVPRGKAHIIKSLDIDKYDIIYYAKFVPPYMENLHVLLGNDKPLIHSTHAPFFIQHMYRPTNFLYEAVMFSQLLLMKARKNTWIHSLNSYEYHNLLRLGFKAYYIPLGVDTAEFQPKKKYDKLTLMFAGARYQKGADLLHHIISGALRKTRDLKFILVGNDFLNKNLRMLEEKYKGSVEIYGYLPRPQFIDKLCRSHALLFPSRYEGCPKIILEALSCRNFIVGFRLQGLHSLRLAESEGAAYLSEYPNIEQLINGIIELYRLFTKNWDRYWEITKRAREIAGLFDWRRLVKFYDRMFRSIIDYE